MSGKENAETEVPGKKNAEKKRYDGKILPGERESGKKSSAEKDRKSFSAIIIAPGDPGVLLKMQTFSLPTLVGVETVSNDTFAFGPE